MSNMLDWAKKEVEMACQRENPNRKEGEFDYGCACYESALKAYKSLCEDGHSGLSIKMTQNILMRLLNGQPLTPIKDTDDIWNYSYEDDDKKFYHCKRMSSLFKDVYRDGTIKYTDVDYSYCVNINNPKITYHSGLAADIIYSMFPITMPYMPGKPIKVYCEDFLVDKENGDFDTFGIFYALKEENGEQKRIEINRFFREPFNGEKESEEFPGWVEISKDEYDQRKAVKL